MVPDTWKNLNSENDFWSIRRLYECLFIRAIISVRIFPFVSGIKVNLQNTFYELEPIMEFCCCVAKSLRDCFNKCSVGGCWAIFVEELYNQHPVFPWWNHPILKHCISTSHGKLGCPLGTIGDPQGPSGGLSEPENGQNKHQIIRYFFDHLSSWNAQFSQGEIIP